MDLSDLLVALLVVVGVLVFVGLGVVAFVAWRYQVPPRGIVAMVGALVYLGSPIDVLPEAVLGPLGLVDDAGVVTAVAFFVYKLVTARRMLQQAGVRPRRRGGRAPQAEHVPAPQRKRPPRRQ